VIVYAEGTRSRDGRVASSRAGSFLLAIEAQLPIVPVAVIGTRAVMPKGRLRTEPADVRLIIHDPIQPPLLDAPTVHDARQLAERVHAVIAETVERWQHCTMAGVPAGTEGMEGKEGMSART
jgi:1-acyl-sn-glycerol-3-phosphate acyltransferase